MNMFNLKSFKLVPECTLKLGTVVAGQPRRTTTAHQPRVMEHTSNSRAILSGRNRNSAALV